MQTTTIEISRLHLSRRTVEAATWTVLTALAAFFISTSWRKWPDPLIDFGRELYVPWRLTAGALLYRDVDAHYGPLSQYFNALLFACFGPGMIVLAIANLIIFGAISAVLYLLCRRAWGVAGAFVAVAVFISVFGFSQITGASNYNYAAPYAHEVTHGLLVSLLLVFVLVRWTEEPRLRWSLSAGGLMGLTALLKPEFMLAACLCAAAAVLFNRRRGARILAQSGAAAFATALLPTSCGIALFASAVPLEQAFAHTTRAWWRFVSTDIRATAAGIQHQFTGADDAFGHLREHLVATAAGAALIVIIAVSGRVLKRLDEASVAGGPRLRALLLVGSITGVVLIWISIGAINWLFVGRALLGLLLIYFVMQGLLLIRAKHAAADQLVPRCCLRYSPSRSWRGWHSMAESITTAFIKPRSPAASCRHSWSESCLGGSVEIYECGS